jgi:hypothetical protein
VPRKMNTSRTGDPFYDIYIMFSVSPLYVFTIVLILKALTDRLGRGSRLENILIRSGLVN